MPLNQNEYSLATKILFHIRTWRKSSVMNFIQMEPTRGKINQVFFTLDTEP